MAESQVSSVPLIQFFSPSQQASNGQLLVARSGVSHCLETPIGTNREVFVRRVDTDPLAPFLATRATILHNYYPSPSQKDRLTASTIAGGMTGGTIGGLFRGPRNIVPGTIMFTLFGYLGQTIYTTLDARHSEQAASDAQALAEGRETDGKRFWERVAEMKWSPLKVLSDEDYGNMLKEKLLRVEAEIALVDEEVERLKEEDRRIKERQDQEPPKLAT